MQRDFDGTIYVKDAPDFHVEDGLVHICHTTGRMQIEFVMRRSTFLKGLRAANRIADELNAKGDVVGIKNGRRR